MVDSLFDDNDRPQEPASIGELFGDCPQVAEVDAEVTEEASSSLQPPQRSLLRSRRRPDPQDPERLDLQSKKQKRQDNLASNRKFRWKSHDSDTHGSIPMRKAGEADDTVDMPQESQEQEAAIASCLFSSDVLRYGGESIASFLGCSRWTVASNIVRFSAAAWDAAYFFSAKIFDQIASMIRQSSEQPQAGQQGFCMRPRLYLHIREYDETPITLMVSADGEAKQMEGGSGDSGAASGGPGPGGNGNSFVHAREHQKKRGKKDSEMCKLFVTEQRWACLLTGQKNRCDHNHGGEGQFSSLCIEGGVPTKLQVIAANTGGLIGKALQQTTSTVYDSTARSLCDLSCDIVCSDNYSANHVAETLLRESREQRGQKNQRHGTFHFLCALPCNVFY